MSQPGKEIVKFVNFLNKVSLEQKTALKDVERSKEYRKRKKNIVQKPAKTAAERSKEYRIRKKTGAMRKPAKTAAERAKEYRKRKKSDVVQKLAKTNSERSKEYRKRKKQKLLSQPSTSSLNDTEKQQEYVLKDKIKNQILLEQNSSHDQLSKESTIILSSSLTQHLQNKIPTVKHIEPSQNNKKTLTDENTNKTFDVLWNGLNQSTNQH